VTGATGWEARALDRSVGPVVERSSAAARQLVDATRDVAAEGGSSEFTMADVAAAAQVSLRTVYRHFAGRDDLLLALFEEEAQIGVALLAQAMDAVPDEARVREFVVGLCSLLMTGEGYASLLLREHLRLGDRRPDELRAALAPLVDLLEAELRAAADAGSIRPVDRHDAVIVFTTVLAHVHAVLLFSPNDDPARAADRLWAFCAAALAPAAAPARSASRKGARR
jgi:TetR/AcrR family transcriptional regulator